MAANDAQAVAVVDDGEIEVLCEELGPFRHPYVNYLLKGRYKNCELKMARLEMRENKLMAQLEQSKGKYLISTAIKSRLSVIEGTFTATYPQSTDELREFRGRVQNYELGLFEAYRSASISSAEHDEMDSKVQAILSNLKKRSIALETAEISQAFRNTLVSPIELPGHVTASADVVEYCEILEDGVAIVESSMSTYRALYATMIATAEDAFGGVYGALAPNPEELVNSTVRFKREIEQLKVDATERDATAARAREAIERRIEECTSELGMAGPFPTNPLRNAPAIDADRTTWTLGAHVLYALSLIRAEEFLPASTICEKVIAQGMLATNDDIVNELVTWQQFYVSRIVNQQVLFRPSPLLAFVKITRGGRPVLNGPGRIVHAEIAAKRHRFM